jgi:hypothetical protein
LGGGGGRAGFEREWRKRQGRWERDEGGPKGKGMEGGRFEGR